MQLLTTIVLVAIAVGVASARPEKYKRIGGKPPRQRHDEATKNKQVKTIPPSCESKIYCQGNLLHTIQMAALFNDSKHFVDMSMNADEDVILKNFDVFMKENNQEPTKEQVEQFVNDNFSFADELEDWMPEDFEEEPPFLETVQPEEIRSYAKKIVAIWPNLGRKISNETLENIQRHSLLPLSKGFIVPGGRFRETYYWDTYWIIKGLLISDMKQTARGMLDNFVTLVKQHGFIPNGARVYYLQRSQPPLFAPMVLDYFRASGDREWLTENIAFVEQEVKFWLENRMITVEIDGKKYHVARYYPESLGPRPESYKEDFLTASNLPNDDAKQKLYTNLKAGAESGWDFSSRWFYDTKGGNNANLSSVDTGRTLPVDLNAFLYKACHALNMLYSGLHQLDKASYWLNKAIEFKRVLKDVFFNKDDGIWYDFDKTLKKHRKEFYVSNLSPLWVHAEHLDFNPDKLIKKLHDDGVFEYEGGTPASLKRTGEQWDLPNAWPPLQAIAVQAIANTETEEGKTIAEKLAKQWVTANMIGYERTGTMFEKYDAEEQGNYGGGGEYKVQAGFGWANGVVLEFIRDYYSEAEPWRF
ncbi:trehalase-like [Atheta coriaria]|uniref:trehalase-like n=1 Tax=Dalotia coriaria TaxID=877792 RepID=UPI0031F446EE